jgi:hypothetical protein
MAQPYVIDFTDPLKASFSIPVAGFNGPGGTQANTTLRLYGRGALDWGEATDENLVRLTESFSSASSPLNPIDGQVWREVKLYWHNTTAGNFSGWYVYNSTTHAWALLNGTGIVASAPGVPSVGFHYYDNATQKLYLYDSRYKQQAAAFFERSFTPASTAPGSAQPETVFKVYSEAAQNWLFVNPSVVTSTTPPTANLEPGVLWFHPVTKAFAVYNGTTFSQIGVGGSTFDMGSNNVTNLATQTYPLPDSNNAATINYVNDGIASAISAGPGAGIDLLGAGIVVKTGAGTYAARQVAPGTGISVTNPAGTAGNPTVAVDTAVIATKAYVDSTVSANIGVVTVEPVSAGVPSNSIGNNGDIRYQY